jgi:Cof subfamily protein (haloacid dehalogenase superfamily)
VEIRLAAVDLDGTLLRDDLTVSPRTRSAIGAARAAGIDVVVVTARSPRSVRDIAREAGIGGLAVCANGALVYDLDRDRIARHTPLPASVVHRIVSAWRVRRPGIAFGWELELRFGSEPAYEALRDETRWPRPDESFEPVDALAWDRPMTKLLAQAPGADLDVLLDEAVGLADGDAVATRAGRVFVELMAPGVGKEAALAHIAGERAIVAAQVAAFGDHLTDVGMLTWAGLGVAVANAQPEVLAVADLVTSSNEEDGVAVVLERLVERRTGPASPQSSSSASVGA